MWFIEAGGWRTRTLCRWKSKGKQNISLNGLLFHCYYSKRQRTEFVKLYPIVGLRPSSVCVVVLTLRWEYLHKLRRPRDCLDVLLCVIPFFLPSCFVHPRQHQQHNYITDYRLQCRVIPFYFDSHPFRPRNISAFESSSSSSSSCRLSVRLVSLADNHLCFPFHHALTLGQSLRQSMEELVLLGVSEATTTRWVCSSVGLVWLRGGTGSWGQHEPSPVGY